MLVGKKIKNLHMYDYKSYFWNVLANIAKLSSIHNFEG